MSDFPNRPKHPDFQRLSEIVIELDATPRPDFELYLAGFIDPESIRYMAHGRSLLVLRNMGEEPTITKLAAFGATYLDAFLAGYEFAVRKQLEEDQ